MSRSAPVIPIGPRRAEVELRSRPDDELMRLAAAGVAEAFNEIVRRHEGQVRAFCARVLGGGAHADDAAQEVFLEVWRTCARYEARGRLRGFLFAAARNRCLNLLRSRPAADEPPVGDAPAPAPDQADALLAAQRRQRLDRAVAALPPKLRDAIWLRYTADLHYGEIAAILRCPEETVRSRVFLGLRRLRKLLGFGADDERSGS